MVFSFVLVCSLGNIDRVLNSDEAIFAEHAYWLNQEGFVKSRLFVDMGRVGKLVNIIIIRFL